MTEPIPCPSCECVPIFRRGVTVNGEEIPDGVSLSCECEVLKMTPAPLWERRLERADAVSEWNECIARWCEEKAHSRWREEIRNKKRLLNVPLGEACAEGEEV